MESLFMIIIVAVVLSGILQVTAYSTKMHAMGRNSLDAYLVAASWFDALETFDDVFDGVGASFDVRAPEAKALLPVAVSSRVSAPVNSISDGVMTVSVDITSDVKESTGGIQTFSRNYNIYGNDTVSDDKVH